MPALHGKEVQEERRGLSPTGGGAPNSSQASELDTPFSAKAANRAQLQGRRQTPSHTRALLWPPLPSNLEVARSGKEEDL